MSNKKSFNSVGATKHCSPTGKIKGIIKRIESWGKQNE